MGAGGWVVGFRALKVIGYREDAEKLAVWTAYLNLENMVADNRKVGCSAQGSGFGLWGLGFRTRDLQSHLHVKGIGVQGIRM